jgi:ABC-type proline/glycine betaine transport system permease subunit
MALLPESRERRIQRRSFATALSLPVVLVLATVALFGLWALLTLSMILALLACAALVAIGLPICILLARRSLRRRFPRDPGTSIKGPLI